MVILLRVEIGELRVEMLGGAMDLETG